METTVGGCEKSWLCSVLALIKISPRLSKLQLSKVPCVFFETQCIAADCVCSGTWIRCCAMSRWCLKEAMRIGCCVTQYRQQMQMCKCRRPMVIRHRHYRHVCECFFQLIVSFFFIQFWYLRCCGCPWNRGRQHLAMPLKTCHDIEAGF